MNGSDGNDHWKDLADEIGAEVPAETDVPLESEDRTEPTQDEPEPATEQSARRQAAPPPPPPEADWDELAADLGLEAPPAPATPSEAPRSARPSPKPTPPAAPEPTRPARSKPAPAAPQQAADSFAAWLDDVAPSSSTAAEETELPSEDPLELPSAPDVSFEELAEGMAAEVEGDLETAEALFESPDEMDEREVAERRQRRRRRRGRRGRSETPKDSEGDQPAVEPTEERSRTRSERTEEDREGAPPRRRRRRRRSSSDDAGKPRSDSTDRATSEDDADELELDEGTSRKHRNIPTWEEVIGCVIESNVNSRSRAPRGDGRRRRGGGRRRS